MLVRRPLLVLLCALLPTTVFAATAAAPKQDFMRSHLDTAVSPGVDFFEYANGGWLKAHPIPDSESSWSIGHEVNEQLRTTLRKINEDSAAGHPAPGSDAQKIGDYWATAMDEARIDALGAHPLDAEFAKIDAISNAQQALDVVFAEKPFEGGSLFRFYVGQDDKKSDQMAIFINQGGLGLPERDFYFNPEAGVAKIREEYVAHLSRLLQLGGRDAAAAQKAAEQVMAFETALAQDSRKLEDLRDPYKNYNQTTPAEFTAKVTPGIDWSARMAAWGLHPDSIVVGQPEFFAALDHLLATTPIETVRDYLRLHLVDDYSPFLSKAYADEDFHFSGQVLSGQKEQRPRWKRVLDSEGGALGMVLGRMFVAEYFSPATKQRYVNMIEAVRASYRHRIEQLDWMSPQTKALAQAKLAAITYKVGYPDHWKDYSTLAIGRESWAANVISAASWRWNDMIGKYGKPVDRTEWGMSPQTYNAYYNASNNEIVLPAAIITVPGVPDAQVDDAVAYGYVAAGTIGHEITHGFDDDGRQYDAAGNLKDWWTADDAAHFKAAAEVLAKQFDAYEPLPGLHINGKAALGENIADFGGILLGLDAFKQTKQYKEGKKIGGLTPLQRYFLGYALGWMSQQREEVLRQALLADVHAPAKWRVLGPMSNIPEFYDAFGVKPGQPMWRPENERVHIW